MLITPRSSKSRLPRQRVRAKFSHSLYRPLPKPFLAGHCELFPWLSSVAVLSPDTGKHVQDCQVALLLPDSDALRAPRYSAGPDMCALLPRHHSEPKGLLLADHFDDTPRGMNAGYSETTKSFRTGSKPARVSFTLLTWK